MNVSVRSIAAVIWLATLVLGVTMLWVLVTSDFLRTVSGGEVAMRPEMFATVVAAMITTVAVTLSYATVGLLLVNRPRGGRIGVILLAGGLAFATVPFGYIVGGTLVLADPMDPLANALFLLGPVAIAPGYALILPVLALAFPSGALPSRVWRLPVGVAVGMLATTMLLDTFRPGEIAGTTSRNPFGVEAMPPWMAALPDVLAGLGIVLLSVLGVAAVIVRYRRGDSVERHQLRWFVAAVLLAAVPIAMSPQPGIGGPIWLLLAAVGLLLVPVAIGIAVTRYRLYEIDRIISRTIGWALVTGVLVAVFAGGVVALQALLTGFTQGETLAVAASTLVVFALFQPVRRRVQRAVDRRFDRARYDAERTAVAFAERLRDEVAIEAVTADLASTVAAALAPAGLGIWMRRGDT